MTKSDSPVGRALALLIISAVTSGLALSGQAPQAIGSWAPTGAVADSREGSASAALADGRTLIAGGYVAGVATASVVIYNPLDNTFLAAGVMTAARVGHTVTALKDGRVLIAGGEIAGVATADLEIFDSAAGSSTMVGTMSSARISSSRRGVCGSPPGRSSGARSSGNVTPATRRWRPAPRGQRRSVPATGHGRAARATRRAAATRCVR